MCFCLTLSQKKHASIHASGLIGLRSSTIRLLVFWPAERPRFDQFHRRGSKHLAGDWSQAQSASGHGRGRLPAKSPTRHPWDVKSRKGWSHTWYTCLIYFRLFYINLYWLLYTSSERHCCLISSFLPLWGMAAHTWEFWICGWNLVKSGETRTSSAIIFPLFRILWLVQVELDDLHSKYQDLHDATQAKTAVEPVVGRAWQCWDAGMLSTSLNPWVTSHKMSPTYMPCIIIQYISV